MYISCGCVIVYLMRNAILGFLWVAMILFLQPVVLTTTIAMQLLFGGDVQSMSATPVLLGADIVLTCKADVAMPDDQRDALCRSVHTALAERAGADRVQPLANGDTFMNGVLEIALHVTRADAQTIEGHLEWRSADDPTTIGPPITLSVDDMPLSPSLYPSFAAGLLKVSDLPF